MYGACGCKRAGGCYLCPRGLVNGFARSRACRCVCGSARVPSRVCETRRLLCEIEASEKEKRISKTERASCLVVLESARNPREAEGKDDGKRDESDSAERCPRQRRRRRQRLKQSPWGKTVSESESERGRERQTKRETVETVEGNKERQREDNRVCV